MLKKFSSIILALIIITTSVFTNQFNVFAEGESRDISATHVTGIEATTTSIYDGERFNVKLTFNDNAGHIKSGDVIRATWPTQGDVFFNGYRKKIPLNVKGKHVGEVSVTPEDVIITFNDKIENIDGVEGWVSFEMIGRNVTDTKAEDIKTGIISIGNKELGIDVTKGESGSSSVFYYKTGMMNPADTDHVVWWLNMNNDQAKLTDRMYVEDRIQPGHELVPESFIITVSDKVSGDRQDYRGIQGVQEFLTLYKESTFDYSVEKNTIDVFISKDDGDQKSFTINYKTKITNQHQRSFKNNSNIWYGEVGVPEVRGVAYDSEIKNINVSAGATGDMSITVKKVWEGREQPRLNVYLLADGNVVDSQELSQLNNWTYTFHELPAFDGDHEIVYTASEDLHEDYKAMISGDPERGFIITNTEIVSIPFAKVWNGEEADSIKVNLIADGVVVDSKEVSAKDNWTGSFDGLEVQKDGRRVHYKIDEEDIAGYTKEITGSIGEGFVITNTKVTPIIPKISFDVSKEWIGEALDSVDVKLFANDKYVETVTLSEVNNWKYTFEDMDETDGENPIIYSVEESAAGYKTEISGDTTKGFTIINIKEMIEEPTRDINVQKIWKGKALESAHVKLLADGEEVKSIELNSELDWNYTFTNLPIKKDNKVIEYTVRENADGYETTIVGDPTQGFIIVNKEIEDQPVLDELVDIPVHKTWVGEASNHVVIRLFADGKEIDFVELNQSNDWSHIFTGLDKILNGKDIEYTIVEDKVKGYDSQVNGNVKEGFEVVNTKIKKNTEPMVPIMPGKKPPIPVKPVVPVIEGEPQKPVVPAVTMPIDPKDSTLEVLEPKQSNNSQEDQKSSTINTGVNSSLVMSYIGLSVSVVAIAYIVRSKKKLNK